MLSVPRRLAAVLAVIALSVLIAPTDANAITYQPLIGAGSSWAFPAINQWSLAVRPQGIVINFSPTGSAAGRQAYTQNQVDFAATDIQYLTSGDPFAPGAENPYSVAYSYIPIVAGGTSFLYNLSIGGQKVTNLRLSGDTITKIFTGQITNWDDPRITHDYGRQLPSEKITPITRSDGSGASYQFTRWMYKEYTSQWTSFCAAHGGPQTNCGPTEFYPGFSGSQQRGSSDQVANYVLAPYGAGSIAYDEYAYAKDNNIPVVKVLNKAGYYTAPTASNVAIALTKAQIDEDPKSLTYLIQNLDDVYTNPDPRTYPLSSYSYLIVPRSSRIAPNGTRVGPPSRFNTTAGATLSTWLNYVLCGAQQSAGQLGYSPLPVNLVQGGFKQVLNIPGHVAIPDQSKLTNCNNPTYHDGVNYLVKDAPYPSACDKVGSPLNCVVGSNSNTGGSSSTAGGRSRNGGGSSGNGGGSSGNGGGSSSNGVGSSNTGGNTTTNSQGSSAKTATRGSTAIDPDTGLPVNDANAVNGTTSQSGSEPFANPVSVNGQTSAGTGVLEVLAALEIVAAVLIPGLLGTWLVRRRREAP